MIDTIDFKNKLESRLAIVTEELKTLGEFNEVTGDWVETKSDDTSNEADLNSEADAVEEMEERGATLSVLENEFNDIKRALNKIEAGAFGICEISGEPIEEARLQFKPTARTCKAHMNEEGILPL